MQKVYVDKSNIHGRGVFAKKNIKKGEMIFYAKGKIVKFIIRNPNDSRIGSRWLCVGKNTWINPDKNNPLYFLNHACNPNAGIRGKITFIALKDIKKDEEIVFDYSISEVDIFWNMKCICKSKNCRKIIHSIQFLPRKIFKKYLPYVPNHSQKAYFNKDQNE